MRQTLLGVAPAAEAPGPQHKDAANTQPPGASRDADVKKRRQPSLKQQKFDFFLVLDFEATCERGGSLHPQVRWQHLTALAAHVCTVGVCLLDSRSANPLKGIMMQELIEFSCCILDGRTLDIVQQFQRYCRPTENAVLTAFCTELTGINQSTYAIQPCMRYTQPPMRHMPLSRRSIRILPSPEHTFVA